MAKVFGAAAGTGRFPALVTFPSLLLPCAAEELRQRCVSCNSQGTKGQQGGL